MYVYLGLPQAAFSARSCSGWNFSPNGFFSPGVFLFCPIVFFSDFDDVWLRCPLTLYIIDILLITVLKKFTVLHENLVSGVFACFVGVFARFVSVSARKKNIKIKNPNKKTANITHRAFLFTWIVHQDLIRIPQNMDKVTFRLSFQFPPQADIWGQAEIQALWKIQVYIHVYITRLDIYHSCSVYIRMVS